MTARTSVIILLVAGALWMAWLAVYQVDDAFIVYRYARNLAAGSGFVFNPGERVEGVTCFLWTLALTPFAAAGLPLPRVAPALTAVAGLAVLALTAKRQAESEGRDRVALRDLLPPTLLLAMPAFAYWSVGALETVPFALLLTAAARDHAQERAGRSGLRSAVWLGIASLVRPETPLIAGALALDRWATRGLASTARWLGVIAAIFVPFLVFRRLYFDAWLPNTYYAKTGWPVGRLLTNGGHYVLRCLASLVPSFGNTSHLVVLLGGLLLVALLIFAWRSKVLMPEAIVIAAVVAAIVLEGGDWMLLHRFWVPTLPSLAIIAASALLRLAERGVPSRVAAAALTAAVVANGVWGAVGARNGGQGLRVQGEGYKHAHLEIARYLNENAKSGDTVALMDIGMIGWYADRLRVIDITGLTDRTIARSPGGFLNKQFPVHDLLARDVRFIVLVEGYPADDRIYEDPEFQARYKSLFKVDHRFNWVPESRYRLFVFERTAP